MCCGLVNGKFGYFRSLVITEDHVYAFSVFKIFVVL